MSLHHDTPICHSRLTPHSDAKELVTELEFVWNQIKQNTPSGSDSKNSEPSLFRRFQRPASGADGPMRVLSPMSEDDAAERASNNRIEEVLDEELEPKKGSAWSRSVEHALVKMSAEVAALREQITAGREWRSKKDRSWPSWFAWLFWLILKKVAIDAALLGVLLLWMRKRKDRRLEDHVRAMLRLFREYARELLPSR